MTADKYIFHIVLISLLVWAIYKTMQPGMIFSFLYDYLAQLLYKMFPEKLAEAISSPLFACVVCMSFWHGLYLYWLVIAQNWFDCIITCIGAIGLNAIISTFIDSKEET